MDFIKNSQNVILAGNPGTGKTHLAIGLGIKACLEGYKVLFTTVPLLVNQLKESRSNRVLMSFENKFEKYDLIIGYTAPIRDLFPRLLQKVGVLRHY